jgi:hypothetical protein
MSTAAIHQRQTLNVEWSVKNDSSIGGAGNGSTRS